MNNRLNDIIKYVIVLGILYIILKKIPAKKMNDNEIAILLFIIMIIFITIDYNCFKNNYELFTDENNIDNSNIFSDPSLSNIERLKLYFSNTNAANIPQTDYSTDQYNATTPQNTTKTVNNITTQQPVNNITTQQPVNNITTQQQPVNNMTTQQPVNNMTTRPVNNMTQQQLVNNMTTLNPTIACNLEIDKIRHEMNLQMQTQIEELKTQINNTPSNNSDIERKYYNSLIIDLLNMKLLTDNDVENINNKLKLKLLTLPEIITSLETLKSTKTSSQVDNSDNKYNELPSGFFTPIGDKIANNWDNDYAILDTKLWTVPMQKPPMCVNNYPSNVSPSSSSNTVNLKEWDNSRVVSNTQINKAWVNKQVLT